jgi:hypothetical protein
MHVDLDLDLISHWRQEEEPRWVIDMGTTTPSADPPPGLDRSSHPHAASVLPPLTDISRISSVPCCCVEMAEQLASSDSKVMRAGNSFANQ